MYLPTFPRRMAAVRHVQTDFRGYDHRPSCPEGGIYEMTNGSAADSPLFSTRPGRTRIYPCSGTPNGLFTAGDGLLWCAGTTLYYNGKAVPGCTLTDTPKVFAALGGTVLIWPDKVWFRPADGTFGSAEPSWSGSVTLAGAGHFHRVGHVPDAFKVRALDHAAIAHIKAGNNAFGDHVVSPPFTPVPAARSAQGPVRRCTGSCLKWQRQCPFFSVPEALLRTRCRRWP